MTDLVKRLRDEHADLPWYEDWMFLLEAADRLEELEAKIERARGLIPRWREGDFDLPDYVRGKMDGCHQCATELHALLGDDDE